MTDLVCPSFKNNIGNISFTEKKIKTGTFRKKKKGIERTEAAVEI